MNHKFNIYSKEDKKLYLWEDRDLYPWFLEIIRYFKYNNKDYVLHQASGYFDKNNEEIYLSCDIVRVTVSDDLGLHDDTIMEGVLYFSKKRWKICISGFPEFSLVFADEIEIIGNIYEKQ